MEVPGVQGASRDQDQLRVEPPEGVEFESDEVIVVVPRGRFPIQESFWVSKSDIDSVSALSWLEQGCFGCFLSFTGLSVGLFATL